MDNSFLEKQIIHLQEKVDEGFSDLRDRMGRIEGALSFHANQDEAAQLKANELDKRLEKVEAPIKWFSGSLWLVGVFTTLFALVKLLQELGII